MKRDYHVVVAGAGMVGLTLAALLSRSGQSRHIRLTIVDAMPEPAFTFDQDFGLRVSAISTGSADILRRANAWDGVVGGRVCAYPEMCAWDAGSAVEGPETLRFSASRYALKQLGFIVENQLIQHALLQSLQALKQQVEFSTSIRSLHAAADRFSVDLSDGRHIKADLLVGADGGDSFVRKQAGITVDSWRYQQAAFVTHLRSEYHHRNTAWQRFLRSGPVALLPLADDRVSIVWSTTPAEAAAAMELSDDALAGKLTEVTDNVLGRLSPAGPRGSFPLRAQHAHKYVLPGLALVGDAAHSVHPLAGQGANLGLADAACLADVIAEAVAGNEVIGDFRVLRRFERARKGANRTMLHFIDGINRLFGTKSPSLAALRATGMRVFNNSGPIRDHAVRVALGLGDR
jgi:2-polyprenylphenol 6-hydroxylase